MSSTTANHGDAVRVLCFVFIIAQSDTKNIECLTSWLQKISLEQLLLSQVLFPSFSFLRTYTSWKELVCLFYKSLLPFLNFVNCEVLYLAEEFLDNLFPCSILRLRNQESSQKQGISLLKQQLLQSATILQLMKKLKNQRSSRSEYAFL